MTKVCMITTGHSPKDDRVFYKESLSLSKAGYDVSIICSADRNGFIRDMGKHILNKNKKLKFIIKNIKIIGIKKPKSLIQRFLNKINMSSYFREFIREGIKMRADIYHAHEIDSLLIALKIQEKINSKVIFDSHESWDSKSLKYKLFEKLWLPKLKYLITVNNSICEVFISKNKLLKTQIIYNASHPEVFKPQLRSSKFKKVIIVHEGSLSFNRGLKEIIEVIRLLKKDFPRIQLRIVGEAYNSEKNYLRDKIKEYSLEKNITETGWLDYEDTGDHLRDCSIGLIMYTFTDNNIFSTPNKLFNYMAYGIAPIAVDLPEITRILERHKCGITIRHRSVENICATIKKLLKKPVLLRKYCENSFKAYKTFNWLNEEKKLLDFYKNTVLKEKPSRIRREHGKA